MAISPQTGPAETSSASQDAATSAAASTSTAPKAPATSSALGTELYDGLYVKYAPAPFMKRLFAYVTDLAVVSAALYLVLIVLGIFGFISLGLLGYLKRGSPETFVIVLLVLVLLLVVGGIMHGYFVYHEHKTGATPGKRLFGLRVVSMTGRRLTLGQCVQRDLMRWVDCMLIVPGLLSTLLSDEGHRLGDLVAGTAVVYSKRQESKADFLYISQDDYLLHLAKLAPSEPATADCQAYLAIAYQQFLKEPTPAAEAIAHLLTMMAMHVAEPAASGLSVTDQTMFFAEYCNQCLNDSKKEKDHGSSRRPG